MLVTAMRIIAKVFIKCGDDLVLFGEHRMQRLTIGDGETRFL